MARYLSRTVLQVTAYLLLKFPVLSSTGMGDETLGDAPMQVFDNWIMWLYAYLSVWGFQHKANRSKAARYKPGCGSTETFSKKKMT
jgi:hypothetical protein